MKTRLATLLTCALLVALTAISFAGPRTLKRYGDDDSWRFARTAFNSSPVQLSLRQNLLSALRDPGMQAPDAITGNGKDFDKNTAMTTDTNYSPTGLPTNTDDVRIIRTSATLTITTASVVMESLSATNGNTYTIGNNGFSGNRTLTLGNSSGFSNTWSGASNDLLYLAGNSTLTIQGPNLGANAQTLALTLASSGNFNVGAGSALTISAAIGQSGTQSITKAGGGILTLSGPAANTYSGLTTVSNGQLDLSKNAGGGGGVNAIAGDVTINGGTLRWLASNQIADGSSIIMSSGAMSLNGQTETIAGFSNSGGTFTTGAGTLHGTGATITWSGGTNTINSGGTVDDKHVVISGGTNTVEAGGLLKVLSGGARLGNDRHYPDVELQQRGRRKVAAPG